MKEIVVDSNIFLLPRPNKRDACLVTTNGVLRRDGKAVMGAGIAKYCRDTYKGIDKELGDKIASGGNHVYNLGWHHKPYDDWKTNSEHFGIFLLYSFPTKDNWRDESKPELIRQSCKEIMYHAKHNFLECCYMPCPGCSNGRLDYWQDVRPILQDELDERFVVCIPTHIMKKHKQGE